MVFLKEYLKKKVVFEREKISRWQKGMQNFPVDNELRPRDCQGLHRLEKYLNLEGFLEKSLKIKSALKSTRKSLKGLEKSLNSTIFCRT